MAGLRSVQQPLPHWVNESQAQVLLSYCDGEFAHLLDESTAAAFEASVKSCGDGLLRFLMVELADSEGVDSMEEGLRRVNVAVDQMRSLADALASRVFDRAAG